MSSEEVTNVVWINRVSKNVTDNDVREHFQDCGTVSEVFICSSRNRSFTYCFVKFENNESVQNALKKNDTQLGDHKIVVALADNRLYERSVKRAEARSQLNDKVVEEIKDMDTTSAYYYGFSQGKKYMLKRMTRVNPRRNLRRSNNNNTTQE